ncbi:MAG: DUF6807 family protein [Planctomycetaceae bacterium]
MNRIFSYCLTLLFLCAFCVSAMADDDQRIRIVLAGDSTVTDHAGWGAGFADVLNNSAECVNLARSGRSSRSYRAERWWQKCMDAKPDYLLIQFGHNDQPGKGPERESQADGDFRDHLRQFVDEARAIGATPILVTPLTRRRWSDQQRIEPTLAEYATATTFVAEEKNVPLLDLHRLSIEQCNAIGPEAFRAFEPMTEKGADHTHLNPEGSRAVGRIVAKQLARIVPDLQAVMNASALEAPAPRPPTLKHSSGNLQLTETDATIAIGTGDRTIVVYNKQSPPVPAGIDAIYQRSGFLHPVTSPNGKVVTTTFPYDHPHQHGIFSAWVRTQWNERNIDFWNLAGSTGRVVHQRVVSTFSDDATIGFEVDLVHRATQEPVVDILRERWKVDVKPTDGTFHCFDLETFQTALTDMPLTVQKYHYGGMALRGPTRWLQGEVKEINPGKPEAREPGEFINDLGSDRKQGNHEKARWVALSGLQDGRPVTITVLCHADNFRAPQSARLHPTKPYFCFSPCVDDDFVIDKQHPLHGRYRYLVTDDAPNAEWLNEQWKSWCGVSQ